MKKNKGILKIVLASIVSLAIGSFGLKSTIAYLSDSEQHTNTFTVGDVKIELLETEWEDGSVKTVPFRVTQKNPQVKNSGVNPAVVFLKITVPVQERHMISSTGEELDPERGEIFYFQVAGTPAKTEANSFNTSDSEWVELTSYEEGTDYSGSTRTYVFAYHGLVEEAGSANSLTETLFDQVMAANIPTEDAPEDADIIVEAYAIQSKGLIDQISGYNFDDEMEAGSFSTDTLNTIYGYFISQGSQIPGKEADAGNKSDLIEGELDGSTILYEAPGAENVPESQHKEYRVPLTLSSNVPTLANTYPEYTTIYNANEGVLPGDQSVTTTTTESYTFKDWKATNGLTYNPGGTYTSNRSTTMTAEWNVAEAHQSITLPTPTREGFIFNGWYTKSSGGTRIGGAGDIITNDHDQTLHAQWTEITYTVSYNANGGSSTPSAQTKRYTQNLTLADAISHANGTTTYTTTFNANGGSSTGATNNQLSSTSTTTYSFASWKATDGTTYSGGGTYSTNDATTMTAQWTSSTSHQNITLPTPTRTGYTFNGWYTDSSGGTKVGNAGASVQNASNRTLYAQWTEITYTVSYNANGGSGAPGNQTKRYTQNLTLSSTKPTKSNSTATRTITLNANGGSSTGDSDNKVTGTITTSYTFSNWSASTGGTYNAGGTYSTNSNCTMTANYSSSTTNPSITLPTPTRAGYTCTGWYTASSGGTKRANAGGSYTPTANETLYAQWQTIVTQYASLNGKTFTDTQGQTTDCGLMSFTINTANNSMDIDYSWETSSPWGGGSVGGTFAIISGDWTYNTSTSRFEHNSWGSNYYYISSLSIGSNASYIDLTVKYKGDNSTTFSGRLYKTS